MENIGLDIISHKSVVYESIYIPIIHSFVLLILLRHKIYTFYLSNLVWQSKIHLSMQVPQFITTILHVVLKYVRL